MALAFGATYINSFRGMELFLHSTETLASVLTADGQLTTRQMGPRVVGRPPGGGRGSSFSHAINSAEIVRSKIMNR